MICGRRPAPEPKKGRVEGSHARLFRFYSRPPPALRLPTTKNIFNGAYRWFQGLLFGEEQVVARSRVYALASLCVEAANVAGATRGTRKQSPFNLISKTGAELKV